MAWENGVWLGRMTEEQKTAGGIWVIGDNPYDPSPDYPGKNSGDVLVKSWVANPDKYGGEGYKPKDRIHEDRWEYVGVLTNRLDCIRHGQKIVTKNLVFPKGFDDIPPEVVRGWHLPDKHLPATGFTILRQLDESPKDPSESKNYACIVLDYDPVIQELFRLHSFDPRDGWRLQYLEVFSGQFVVVFPGTTSTQLILTPGQHVFFWHGGPIATLPLPIRSTKARGVMIYLK